MTRHDLIALLETHYPFDADEARYVAQTIDLINTVPDCFHRHEMRGHISASAWLLSRDGSKVLMNYHKSLDCWLVFGGHSDGDEDPFAVAARELDEESGVKGTVRILDELFDIDVHPIAFNAKKNEPQHNHHDCLVLFRCTDSEDFTVSDESVEMRWMTPDEVLEHNNTPNFQRLVKKWQLWQKQLALAA